MTTEGTIMYFIYRKHLKNKTFELGLYCCCSKQHLAHLWDGTKNIISFSEKQHSGLPLIIEYSSKT